MPATTPARRPYLDIPTEYGTVRATFHAGPSRLTRGSRWGFEALEALEPPTVRALLATAPGELLTINRTRYGLEGWYLRDGLAWQEDRASGWYTRLRRVHADGTVDFVTDLGPTDAARSILHGVIVPAVLSRLSGGAVDVAGRIAEAQGIAAEELERDARDHAARWRAMVDEAERIADAAAGIVTGTVDRLALAAPRR